MPNPSYGAGPLDAMPDFGGTPRSEWVELPSHRHADEAVARWTNTQGSAATFRVSGACGVGKTAWFERFVEKTNRTGLASGRRVRWAVARFGKGEPVLAESLERQWSACLVRWVERPARYAGGFEARKWIDLAVRAQQAEGFTVVRVIESDRGRLTDSRKLAGLTEGILWLAREPFRGSRAGQRSIVLPVWSHDELAFVLARRFPGMHWNEETVSHIWARSRGHARFAVEIAAALLREASRKVA